jgi:hypothetical protein
MISLDVGGQSDPAAIVAMSVRTVDRLIKAQVHYLAIKPPIVTPTAHLTFVEDTLKLMRRQIGIAPVRVVVDVSSNSGIANLLAQALPKNSMVAIRISGGDAHGAGVTAFPIGDVGGKATALPALVASRRQMLLDVGQALSSRLLTLPVDDKEQAEGLAIAKNPDEPGVPQGYGERAAGRRCAAYARRFVVGLVTGLDRRVAPARSAFGGDARCASVAARAGMDLNGGAAPRRIYPTV